MLIIQETRDDHKGHCHLSDGNLQCSDAIWRPRTLSTLDQVIACHLLSTNQLLALNHCLHIVNRIRMTIIEICIMVSIHDNASHNVVCIILNMVFKSHYVK